MRMSLALVVVLSASVLCGCEKILNGILGRNSQSLVLSETPIKLGTQAVQLASHESIKVLGETTDLCATLSDSVEHEKATNYDFKQLSGDAHITAVLHASDGHDYLWPAEGTHWKFSTQGAGNPIGSMAICLRWEMVGAPPKGTEITSIDLISDRTLRVLDISWNSTDAFDHIAHPRPATKAVATPIYLELEIAYAGQAAWTPAVKPALQMSLQRAGYPSHSEEFNSTLSLHLGDTGVQIEPGPLAVDMAVLTIPTAAVEACSMSCWSRQARIAGLLLPEHGIQINVLNQPEVIDWCWRNHIPIADAESVRKWMDKKQPLPARDTYASQFDSSAAYEDQVRLGCGGIR